MHNETTCRSTIGEAGVPELGFRVFFKLVTESLRNKHVYLIELPMSTGTARSEFVRVMLR